MSNCLSWCPGDVNPVEMVAGMMREIGTKRFIGGYIILFEIEPRT
ncbi:MAG: hypothetical protein BWY89_01183 [Bacteroidetes bacterium ADurb.BinA012]|nr:MAG: hypothetical protein BWY89_01183 [Bacteroidetes bacterium ADurb.BinA012]